MQGDDTSLAGVPIPVATDDDNDNNDEDTSLTGVQGDDTSLAGVPIPILTNNDDDGLDSESDHNSIDPNDIDNNSSKASVHSPGSHAQVHNMTDEPTQLPLDEEELDNIQ